MKHKSKTSVPVSYLPPSAITVTKPSLPPLGEYVKLLRDIWERQWLTNSGYYHDRLEQALAKYLEVPNISLFCNGMIALEVGLQALGIKGEVITTPFSFVATTHAIFWNHCTPVFCDVDPETFNLDPDLIESLITPKTTAILPVHVYGRPCAVKRLQEIASAYGLKLFYDAAHAFGVKLDGESLLNHGDLSMLSFHATKSFTTAEGGALVTGDRRLKKRIDFLRNFGFADETTVVGPGTNGKMNELQAALGVLQLKHVDEDIKKRLNVATTYKRNLASVAGIRTCDDLPGTSSNGGYFPILVKAAEYGISRDELYEKLKTHCILSRRYFYPLISECPAYRNLPSARNLPVARAISREVLCLPIYSTLEMGIVDRICDLVATRCRRQEYTQRARVATT